MKSLWLEGENFDVSPNTLTVVNNHSWADEDWQQKEKRWRSVEASVANRLAILVLKHRKEGLIGYNEQINNMK